MMELSLNPQYTDNTELKQLLCSLPKAFDTGEGELIYDKRNKLRRFVLSSGQVVVVKRYKRPNWVQRISYSWFGPNKAQKAFDYASRLHGLGIDTPQAIAAVTYRGAARLVQEYYLATTEDTRPSCWWLNDSTESAEWQALCSALAQYLAELHTKGFMHGDTNLSNFLYEKTPSQKGMEEYHFAVIDINRSRFVTGRKATQSECLDNLFRLSHHRNVIRAIVSAYASHRQWDVEACVSTVIGRINRFERKKRILSYFK